MNRRDFVACGGGVALALGAGAWTAAWPRDGKRAAPERGALPFAAIFDSRFPDSLEFGKGAARFGCETRAIRGDVTELWLRQMRPRWARGEGAVVGMTTAASFVCIQQLAAEFWMPVVARVEHAPQADASVRHRMQLHDAVMPDLEMALVDAAAWPTGLVAPLARSLDGSARGKPARAVVVTRPSPATPSQVPLVSWAIAIRGEVPT